MAVKVPPLLHKMSMAAQKAWYKKHNMEMPSGEEGKSAAKAKKVTVIKKTAAAVKPQSIRDINAARQKAYYEKGGRAPIGAGGSGGSNAMAGVGMSNIKQIRAAIKAGVNPKVAESVVNEATKAEAEKTLGGPVKEKPKMPPGKQPAGYRYVRGLARKAMKAGMKKEEVAVDEAKKPDASMAMTNQLRMKAISNKDKKTLGKVADLMAAQKKQDKKPMKEESEMQYIEEKLTAADPASKWISDFVASDNPKFAGKSKKERIQQALGAYYAAKRGTNEQNEFLESKKMEKGEDYEEEKKEEEEDDEDDEDEDEEEMDEAYIGFKKLKAKIAAKGGARNPAAVAAAIGRKKYGKEKFQAAAAAGKKMSEAMDPVGSEDKDINNDKKVDKTDVYLHSKRKAIGAAIRDKLKKKIGN